MIWTTWRQSRSAVLAVAAVLVLLGVAVIVTGNAVTSSYQSLGVAHCLNSRSGACSGILDQFRSQFGPMVSLVGWVNLLPALTGALIGGPLVARELESGTFRLAFTQGVTRRRWILTKVAGLACLALVVGAVLIALMSWWPMPWGLFGGHLQASAFDSQGVVPVAYFLLALALGTAAGTVIRRTVPAIAITLAIFVPFRVFTDFWLRPDYMAPIVINSNPSYSGPAVPTGALVLSNNLLTRGGHLLSNAIVGSICPASAVASKADFGRCLSAHGVVAQVMYQPPSRFWSFQFIEFGIYLALAALLFATAVWWTTRRLG